MHVRKRSNRHSRSEPLIYAASNSLLATPGEGETTLGLVVLLQQRLALAALPAFFQNLRHDCKELAQPGWKWAARDC